LAGVRAAWESDPDMRLGQLIVNLLRPSRPCPQIFYSEDTVLEQGLAAFQKEGHQKYTENEIALGLTLNEAIVLIAFLQRFRDKEQLAIDDPAEEQLLYALCAMLEKQLGMELSDPGWIKLLGTARQSVRESPE